MTLPGRVSLAIEQGSHPPTRLWLNDSTIRIGRDRDSHIHVPEAHISRQHAEIRTDKEGHVVVDLGSAAANSPVGRSRVGVLVNGERIQRHVLVDGDVIELGPNSPVRITYRVEQIADRPHEASSFSAVVADTGQGGMGRLARFFEFSHKLGGGFTLEEVLQDVVDLAIEVTRAERGMLIVRRDDDSLDTRVARASGGRSLPIDGLRVSETLVHKSFAAGKPSVFADVNQDAALAMAESIVSLELRSAVTLPLMRFEAASAGETATQKVFGLIYLDSRRMRGGFDGIDLGILVRLASDASSVIENARHVREAEEQRRIAREVKMAREVQAALMPEQFRSIPGFDIAGTCLPCHDLGGDYVDQFDLGDGRMALVVADVCGKGIAASLLAATLQGALAAEIVQGHPLGTVVAHVNRVHCRLAPVGKFITMAVAVLEPSGVATLVNAGHCPVLHVHAGGVTAVATDDMALGLDADTTFKAVTLQLQPGDTVVLYTDGVIECEGPDRELFGDERLARVLTAQRGKSADQVLAAVLGEVETFRRGVPVSDDLSLLVVHRT
jgi:phosphoserine phosphatase RsbU/P